MLLILSSETLQEPHIQKELEIHIGIKILAQTNTRVKEHSGNLFLAIVMGCLRIQVHVAAHAKVIFVGKTLQMKSFGNNLGHQPILVHNAKVSVGSEGPIHRAIG